MLTLTPRLIRPHRFLLLLFLLTLLRPETPAHARQTPRNKQKDNAAADAFFATNGVLLLRIEIPEAGMASLRKTPRKFVSATLREGDKVYEDVGVHIKGAAGSFRGLDDKPGLTLSFSTFEATDYFHGLKKLHLNNGAQDGTYLSEMTCAGLFRAAGVPASRATHALVELNGRKLGLFVLLEGMEKDFLARHFKNPKGSLYGQSAGGDVNSNLERMEGSEPLTRADLKALTAAATEPDPARRLEALRKTLDIERFLSFMALEIMLCHWDGYTFAAHNYRVYHDLDTDRILFFPHDMDQMMGDTNLAIEPGVNGLISQSIMRTPELRTAYRQRFGQIFTNYFRPTVLTNQIHQVVQRALPALKAYNPNIARDFENNSASLKNRILARAQTIERLLTVGPPQPLRFDNGVARLKDWRKEPGDGGGQLDATTHDGRKSLWIKNATGEASSWRLRLPLPAGRFRFEGLARVKDATSPASPTGQGAGLRISGSTESRQHYLKGSTGWEKLTFEFDVPSNQQEVDLVCELRGPKGEAWFDTESLRLVRLK